MKLVSAYFCLMEIYFYIRTDKMVVTYNQYFNRIKKRKL